MNKIVLGLGLCMILMGAKWDLSKTGGKTQALRFSCSTTAARIIDVSKLPDHSAIRISNLSSTPVFVGGPDVDTVATAGGLGYPICTDASTCTESSITVAVTTIYCIVASGSIVVNTVSVRQ